MGRASLKDARRTEIIDAFIACASAESDVGTSLKSVANMAGVQTSIIHHYFQSRDDLIESAVAEVVDRHLKAFSKETEQYADPRERLTHGLAYLFGKDMLEAGQTRFLFTCLEQAKSNARVRESMAGMYREFRSRVVSFLDEMEALSQLPARKKETIAALLVAVHEGYELQWFLDPTTPAPDDYLQGLLDMLTLLVASVSQHR